MDLVESLWQWIVFIFITFQDKPKIKAGEHGITNSQKRMEKICSCGICFHVAVIPHNLIPTSQQNSGTLKERLKGIAFHILTAALQRGQRMASMAGTFYLDQLSQYWFRNEYYKGL